MYQQTDSLFYRFRFILAGLLTIACLMVISAVVTVVGSGSVLAAKTSPTASGVDINTSDGLNVVTDGMFSLIDGTKQASLTTGTALYTTCHSITIGTAHAGESIVHGGSFIGRGIASSTMFVLRIPGKIMGSINNTHAVGVIIRPTDNNPVPVISTEISPEMLSRLSAQAKLDQQKDAELQAAQLLANQKLGGSIVAGDPHHGKYPSDWDAPTRQDSRLDSWGMYNRECVSYTAWKVYQTYGKMPYWGGVGNANQWINDAKVAGIAIGSTPQIHSVAISMRGYYGHAMWVEAISGNMIYVSQYNYDLNGRYSEMWVSSSALTYIYFK